MSRLEKLRSLFEELSSEYGGGGIEVDEALESMEDAIAMLQDAIERLDEAWR